MNPHAVRFRASYAVLMTMILALLGVGSTSRANEKTSPPRLPCQTGIPSPLRKPKDIVPLGCERPFLIRGDVYSTDSPQAQDASTLKYFVQSVPESNSILETYQNNIQTSKTSAYIGTLGLIMFLFSDTIGQQFDAGSSVAVTKALRLGGATIALGGFFFTFSYLNSNESLIPKAVEAYNQANPKDPIELQFTTGWRF